MGGCLETNNSPLRCHTARRLYACIFYSHRYSNYTCENTNAHTDSDSHRPACDRNARPHAGDFV